MDDEGCAVALNWAKDALTTGRMSREIFVRDYCTPAAKGGTWMSGIKKRFPLFRDSPMTRRVFAWLSTSGARPLILACIAAGVRLEGVSEEQRGIEQCRSLIAELEKLSGTKVATGSSPTADAAAIAESGGGAGSGGDKGGAAGAGTDDTRVDVGLAMETEGLDPMHDLAAKKTEAEMQNITYYKSVEEMSSVLCKLLSSADRLHILIDAPSWKIHVPVGLVRRMAEMLKSMGTLKYRILVPAGGRLEILCAIAGAMTSGFPKTSQFTIMLDHGSKQGVRKKKQPTFNS